VATGAQLDQVWFDGYDFHHFRYPGRSPSETLGPASARVRRASGKLEGCVIQPLQFLIALRALPLFFLGAIAWRDALFRSIFGRRLLDLWTGQGLIGLNPVGDLHQFGPIPLINLGRAASFVVQTT